MEAGRNTKTVVGETSNIKGYKPQTNILNIVKILSENNILIEAETNKEYRTVEKLKKEINNTNIPFDDSNYFVKKAEEELEKIKNGEF